MQSSNEIISLLPSTLLWSGPALSSKHSSKWCGKRRIFSFTYDWDYWYGRTLSLLRAIEREKVKRVLTDATVNTYTHAQNHSYAMKLHWNDEDEVLFPVSPCSFFSVLLPSPPLLTARLPLPYHPGRELLFHNAPSPSLSIILNQPCKQHTQPCCQRFKLFLIINSIIILFYDGSKQTSQTKHLELYINC